MGKYWNSSSCNKDCDYEPTVIDDGKMSLWQRICYVFDQFNKNMERIDDVESQLNAKEDSVNITGNRKLSETGDFTGTLANHSKSALQVVQQIDNNRDQIIYLIGQFADGQTGQVIDGGFFEETGIKRNYDGGVF